MPASYWPTRRLSVTSLRLDTKNPRLGRSVSARAPREIIQHLFDHDKAIDVAASIAGRGYFPNEPLLAIREGKLYVVVEGNRRLAALKALRQPGLLEGPMQRKVERLSGQIADLKRIATVPVTVAPNRRATDRQIVGRHIGTPVLAWEAENRASFILEKRAEGYDNDKLRDELGFSLTDIQKALQTRAIADMARSLDLPDKVRAKLEAPRAKIFTTLERVFESSVGRDALMVKPDTDHGLRGTTTKKQFVRGFEKLVTDVALGNVSSRTLNSNEDIKDYFQTWSAEERPAKKRGSFVPSDVIQGRSAASSTRVSRPAQRRRRQKQICPTVIPKSFKVLIGTDRLVDIQRELTRLKRAEYPNAGAVLLRVFFELSVVCYLKRTGGFEKVTRQLRAKGKLQARQTPTLKQLVPEITRIAKERLSPSEAEMVEKALKYDRAAPFSISELHSFVHSSDPPGEREIRQFWSRTEPLFRVMLQEDVEDAAE